MDQPIVKWSQDTLIKWVNTLSSLKAGQKAEIIKGIKEFGAAGKDVFDADKDELVEAFEIGGMLAGKLFNAIGEKKNESFQSNNPTDPNNGSEEKGDDDGYFSLNLQGQKGSYCRIDKFKKTYTVKYLKKQYLDYYGHDLQNEAKRKGLSIYRMGTKLAVEDSTLESYNIVDETIELTVIFRVDGGSEEKGDDHQWIEKPMCEWSNDDVRHWMQSLGKSFKELSRQKRFSKIDGAALVELNGDSLKSYIKNKKDRKTFLALLDSSKDRYNLLDHREQSPSQTNGQSKPQQQKKPATLYENQAIKVFNTKSGECTWCDAKVNKIYSNGVDIEYTGSGWIYNTVEFITKENVGTRIKLPIATPDDNNEDEKTSQTNNGEDWEEISMALWTNKHVQCWVGSLSGPFKKKVDKFKNMNGKILLNTTEDTLSLIIASKMLRRKFMVHLKDAKEKYNVSSSTSSEVSDVSSGSATTIVSIVGLNNLGSTCYMNTSVQLLSQTPSLGTFLAARAQTRSNDPMMDKARRKYNNNTPMLDSWTNLCDFIFNKSSNGRGYIQIYSPNKIKNALLRCDSDFGSGEQDDSSRSLRVMLDVLDKEIEQELYGEHNRDNMSLYEVKHGQELQDDEEQMIVQELLNKHNPKNSIIRKLFDGIQRLVYTCGSCQFKYRQYKTFRVMDLPVVSNIITFNNIQVIIYGERRVIDSCSALDYSTVDVLKYQILQQINVDKLDLDSINLLAINQNGKVEIIPSNTPILTIQKSYSHFFAFVEDGNDKYDSKHYINLLSFDIFIDENGKLFQDSKITIGKYKQNTINKMILHNIEQYLEVNTECNIIVKFNDRFLDTETLESGVEDKIKTSRKQYNTLITLCINKQNDNLSYESKNMDDEMVSFATSPLFSSSCLWNTLLSMKQAFTDSNTGEAEKAGVSKKRINECRPAQIQRISDTLNELQKQKNINKYIQAEYAKFEVVKRGPTELTNINQCLDEYQRSNIIDQSRYSYKCKGCRKQCRILQLTKTIIYAPKILVLHLDRFGKNVSNVNTERQPKYQRDTTYELYDKISIKEKSKWYPGEVIDVKGNKIKISFDGYGPRYDEWIEKKNISKKIRKGSNGSTNTRSYSYRSGNKFDHDVQYKLCLKMENAKYSKKNQYDLYGISNHSGDTKFGHYTANIKCVSNQQWYDISDTSVRSMHGPPSPNQNARSATIVMYSQTN